MPRNVMEKNMKHVSWRPLAAVCTLILLGACAQMQPAPAPQPVAANPPPVAPGAEATWYHVGFETNGYGIDAAGQKVVADVLAHLQRSPGTTATIIGRTDTVGSRDYNMRLSHRRADSVRDALIYNGKMNAERVETRWTGEGGKGMPKINDMAMAGNRVVDIAVH